jgi:anti-sigma factor RsiW
MTGRDSDSMPTEADLMTLNALADGELDADAARAIEKRIAEEPRLAAEYERILAAKAAIRGLGRSTVDEAFTARIAALAAPAAPAARSVGVRPARPAAGGWLSMAASIAVTAIAASGATYLAVAPSGPPALEVAIADDHMRSLLAASPVDVVSSDRHTVKPWLDAKLGVSPPAIDLAQQGFVLVGGRVDVIGGRATPSLVYRHNEHLISLIALPAAGTGPATEPISFDAGGYHMVKWNGSSFAYWAVSDLEPAELAQFVRLYRAGS